ncbi:MAG: hypothetical protein JWN70_3991, partial [Planctomycetaceae bacterium]|nr:hypothetical protein [Planctomycetaceae bacterium]
NGAADVLVYDKTVREVSDYLSGGRIAYVCEWDK